MRPAVSAPAAMLGMLARILALGASLWLLTEGSGAVRAAASDVRATAPRGHQRTEHRYRVTGRVRLLLFWSPSADVGTARMTWESSSLEQSIALLIGSDPRRAPRRMNEWGYMREEVRGGQARAFEVRSLTIAGFNPERPPHLEKFGQAFGAVCATADHSMVESRMTTVRADDLSYLAFDRLLDRISAAPSWEVRRTKQPLDAAPGFLTALQRLIAASLAAASDGEDDGGGTAAPLTYVYKEFVYDLSLRKIQRAGRRTIRGTTYDNLARADFAIRNHTTRDVTKFSVTYPVDGPSAGVPVFIRFQPNWWLNVDLSLDGTADVPPDPAADAATLARIRSICTSAAATAH
jgi:hypothetical protein